MFFANKEILGFYSILELVLYEIVKHDGYLIVRFLMELDNGFDINMKSYVNAQNENLER